MSSIVMLADFWVIQAMVYRQQETPRPRSPHFCRGHLSPDAGQSPLKVLTLGQTSRWAKLTKVSPYGAHTLTPGPGVVPCV